MKIINLNGRFNTKIVSQSELTGIKVFTIRLMGYKLMKYNGVHVSVCNLNTGRVNFKIFYLFLKFMNLHLLIWEKAIDCERHHVC